MNGYEGQDLRRSNQAASGLYSQYHLCHEHSSIINAISLAPSVNTVSFSDDFYEGTIFFDVVMNTNVSYSDIISVDGANLVDGAWTSSKQLWFKIIPWTTPQEYTLNALKARGRSLDDYSFLDGNTVPEGENGMGPSWDNYTFEGWATGITKDVDKGFKKSNDTQSFVTKLKNLSSFHVRNKLEICYQIANPTKTEINIFDCNGRVVNTIQRNDCRGAHTYIWTGLDKYGRKVPSGCYFIKFKADDYKVIKKFILLNRESK